RRVDFASLLRPPRHARPTAFPYTTLFRSNGPAAALPRHDEGEGAGSLVAFRIALDCGRLDDFSRRSITPWPEPPPATSWFPPKLDRKSTRLNSSHVKISYAVFCLKKKKTK